jgi:hypothetical protein
MVQWPSLSHILTNETPTTATGILNRLRRPFIFALVILSITLWCGCKQRQPLLVPVSEVQPLMTYQNSSPRFRLKVFMYAPGNLLVRVENLLEGFELLEVPDVTSPTGRILQARLPDQNTFEFNLILPDSDYTQSPNDVTIPWVLEEKGAAAFLRSEGNILMDISTSPSAKYFVKSVEYQSGTGLPQSRKEKL